MKTFRSGLMIGTALFMISVCACKQESRNADPSLGAFGGDSLTQENSMHRQTSGNGKAAQTEIPSRKMRPAAPTTQGASGGPGSSGSSVIDEQANNILMHATGKYPQWWDNRTIMFLDWVGGASDIVYEAIKGQRYFPNTLVFVYCTDNAMKGTKNYDKTEDTMKGTPIDDRIFIWVNLDDNRKLVFVKTLISDNIKDKIDEAPLQIK